MKTTVDLDAHALYIRVAREDTDTVSTDALDSGTLVDLAADGSVVGIEIIGYMRSGPLARVLDSYNFTAEDEALLRAMAATGERPVTFMQASTVVERTPFVVAVA